MQTALRDRLSFPGAGYKLSHAQAAAAPNRQRLPCLRAEPFVGFPRARVRAPPREARLRDSRAPALAHVLQEFSDGLFGPIRDVGSGMVEHPEAIRLRANPAQARAPHRIGMNFAAFDGSRHDLRNKR